VSRLLSFSLNTCIPPYFHDFHDFYPVLFNEERILIIE
jgi:hypothetical protein